MSCLLIFTVRCRRRTRFQRQHCLVRRLESAAGRCGVSGGLPHTRHPNCSSSSLTFSFLTVKQRLIFLFLFQEFDPEIVLVSAGFDATTGHPSPMGGYQVSPACFGYMTRQLMELAGGRVIMALEGGYDLPSICDASHECVKALLGEETAAIRPEELARRPCQNAIDSLRKTISIQVLWFAFKITRDIRD